MIAQDYIDSGILNDYCLGLLSEEQEKEVNTICNQYPQIANELQILKEALEKYAGSNNIQNRKELRKVIWESVKKWMEENR